jgi:molybdopterin converting factor small subunit
MKRLLLGLFIVILVIGAVACGSPGDPAMILYQGNSNISEDEIGSIRQEFGLYKPNVGNMFLEMDDAEEKAPPPGFGGDVEVQSSPGAEPTAPEEPAVITDRLIIRTGYMTIVVEDVTLSIQQIANLAASYNGYVVNSQSQQDGDRMIATISIRVDAAYFDVAMQAVRNMAVEVTAENTSGQDVTEEYVDLQARLKNLEASEAQLLDLMEHAGTVEEILEVQREVTNTREQIEQIKGRIQYLEQSSATSLIQVSLVHSKLAVEFVANTRVIKEGDKVWFNPEVSGGFEPFSFLWDFGDSETTNEEFPGHEFNDDGAFTVTLTVTDDKGNIDTYERVNYITVLPGWDVGSVADSIWHGMVNFGRGLVNVLIGIGISSPVWIVILIILYFAWWRRRKKKSKQKSAE